MFQNHGRANAHANDVLQPRPLLDGCFKRAPAAAARVALLIEGFPRPHHPFMEFAKLLFLLREHGAKATFVVDWHDIRERGLCASVGEMMQLLTHNEHEVAVKFKTAPCNASHLRQQAVEALHFLQRVYGITVVSAKVGCRCPPQRGAAASGDDRRGRHGDAARRARQRRRDQRRGAGSCTVAGGSSACAFHGFAATRVMTTRCHSC